MATRKAGKRKAAGKKKPATRKTAGTRPGKASKASKASKRTQAKKKKPAAPRSQSSATARPVAGRAKVKGRAGRATTPDDRVVVETVNVPGYSFTVEREKYQAMRGALLEILPASSPGLSQTEMHQAILPHLPQALFPGGAKAMWWLKCVQLDLEAKGVVVRDSAARPLRWWRVGS